MSMSFLKNLGKSKKKYTPEEYDVGDLKDLPPLCKKLIAAASISPEEALEDVDALMCCLHFDVKNDPEAFKQLKRCVTRYRRKMKQSSSASETSEQDSTTSRSASSSATTEDTKGPSTEGENGSTRKKEPKKKDKAAAQEEDEGKDETDGGKKKRKKPQAKKKGKEVAEDEKPSKGSKKAKDGSKKKGKKAAQDEEQEDSSGESSGVKPRSKSIPKDSGSNDENGDAEDDENSDKRKAKKKKKRSSTLPRMGRSGDGDQIECASKDELSQEQPDSFSASASSSAKGGGGKGKKGGSSSSSAVPDPDMFITENPVPLFANRHKIGRGAFGDVYTAKDKSTNTTVAIKILKKTFSEDSSHITNEIDVLKSCNHQNIVNYLKSHLWEDRIWLVMEYCDGGTLNKLLSEVDLNEGQIANITGQVLAGLSYLHSQNRIHRDIKADNILLNMNGCVKVADLGLVAEMEEGDDAKMSIAGSRYWMAPEMIRRKPYNCKVDIWSTGALVIEMAQRHPPYYGLRPLKAMYLVATKGAPPLKNQKKWSPDFKDFLAKCLTLNPDERPTADELLQHPFITKRASPTSKLVQAIGIVFLGNSLRMNGF